MAPSGAPHFELSIVLGNYSNPRYLKRKRLQYVFHSLIDVFYVLQKSKGVAFLVLWNIMFYILYRSSRV